MVGRYPQRIVSGGRFRKAISFRIVLLFLAAAAALPIDSAADDTEEEETRWLSLFGVNVSTPLVLSGSATGMLAPAGDPFTLTHHGPLGSGLLGRLELGMAGCKLGVGYGSMAGLVGGYSASAIVLRTWRNPWIADEDTTYIGLEGTATVGIVRLSLGPLYRLSEGRDYGRRWSAIVGVGIGF
jgi:hypothetical protein